MCCVFAILCSVVPRSLESAYRDRQYLNEWAVEIPGGLAAAEAVAKELDYDLLQQVSLIIIIICQEIKTHDERKPAAAHPASRKETLAVSVYMLCMIRPLNWKLIAFMTA